MTGPLYSFAQWFLSVLPVDEAGCRCCEETLADWRKEAATATGNWAAIVVSMRAMFAVARCVAGVSLREVSLIGRSGVLTRVLLWTSTYLVAMRLMVQPTPDVVQLSGLSQAYLLASAVAFFFPVALLLATGIGRTRQRLPALGIALAALLIAAPMLGWAVPHANRTFMTEASKQSERFRYRTGDGLLMATNGDSREPFYAGSGFGNDLTVVQIAEKVAAGPSAGGWNAIRWISFFGAYIAMCALAPVMASASRRGSARIRYALVTVTTALLFVQPWQRVSFGEFSIIWWLGSYWVPVLWMMLCLIAVTRRSHAAPVPSLHIA